MPDAGLYLWQWFWELSATRRSNDTPISYLDIAAWRELTGNLITPVECGILTQMDAAFREALGEEIRANAARAEVRSKRFNKNG